MRKKTLVDYFENLEDPRIERGKRHSLLDIITIANCAVTCGADSWVYMRCSARARKSGSGPFWNCPTASRPVTPLLSRGQAFGDVFSRLDPDRFQECFTEWSQGVAQLLPGEVVAIDGKTARHSHDT